ncbi:MAG: hypothetical protein EA374_01760 [Acholeplasmatales bacterium]|nr:MAG: hypothetical protein EA374_01760 [Acholeplasmatales bacterium]
MEQFDLVLKDFANWKMDNWEVLERFKETGSYIYERFEPVYAVLNHIYERAVELGELDEERETIFSVGLNYLHAQFEVIKIYYEKLFDSNCEAFEAFMPLVGYLLFIADFRSDLEEVEDSLNFDALNEAETLIENMIAERRQTFDYAGEKLNEAIRGIIEHLDFEYVSIIDIFVEIAENLNIELSTNESFIVGEDI